MASGLFVGHLCELSLTYNSLMLSLHFLSLVVLRVSFHHTNISIVKHKTGVPIREDAPPSELAVAVARHFEQFEVSEEDAIMGFLERLEKGDRNEYARSTAYYGPPPVLPGANPNNSGNAAGNNSNNTNNNATTTPTPTQFAQLQRKRRRTKYAARPGEQVAAKVTRTDENGSWILASVQRFYSETETYDVQDEDDTSKLIRLPWANVMQLSTGHEGLFGKNTECMAIFPETTSFYRAIVSKAPVWSWDEGRRMPVVRELVVKFEDDEDGAGRTPHRRVPSRYVIPLPSEYFYDAAEDVDLTPPK